MQTKAYLELTSLGNALKCFFHMATLFNRLILKNIMNRSLEMSEEEISTSLQSYM